MATTAQGWSLFPGFPLTAADYHQLEVELTGLGISPGVVVAHSLGCLEALALVPAYVPLVLLAPSHPHRRRRGRHLQALALQGLDRVPVVSTLAAEQLRHRAFAAFNMPTPTGPALPLGDAAGRLRTPQVTVTPRPHCWILTSASDPRHTEQVQLADLLQAPVQIVEGCHMFPITHPGETAHVIATRCVPVGGSEGIGRTPG